MITNKNLTYGVAALVAAGVALVVGVPAYFLLFLACPVMMLFMMSSMSGGNTRDDADTTDTTDTTASARAGTNTTTPDGSHDRL